MERKQGTVLWSHERTARGSTGCPGNTIQPSSLKHLILGCPSNDPHSVTDLDMNIPRTQGRRTTFFTTQELIGVSVHQTACFWSVGRLQAIPTGTSLTQSPGSDHDWVRLKAAEPLMVSAAGRYRRRSWTRVSSDWVPRAGLKAWQGYRNP